MLRLEFINIEETFKHLRDVRSPRIFYRKKFDPHGIFSEQIFGPVEDYRCQCGYLQGREFTGIQCPKCGVTVGTNKARSMTFAKITLPDITPGVPLKLLNPLATIAYQKRLVKITKKLKVNIMNVACGKQYAKIENDSLIRATEDDGQIGPHYIESDVIPWICSINKQTKNLTEAFQPYMFTSIIPVLPPNVRAISKIGTAKYDYQISAINKYYMKILRIVEQIKQSPYIFDTVLAALQNEYTDLIQTILAGFSTKKGFLRKYILGKRVDYSGRAVIAVDPTIELDQCKVPYKIMYKIFKPALIKKLSQKLNISEFNIVKYYDTEQLKPYILQILKDTLKDSIVLLNRQPTLHRHSIEAFRIADVIDEDVIKIHPLITDPFNADFDGDQMAIYVPLLTESIEEAKNKLAPVSNLRLPSNGKLAYVPKQDVVLGLATLTKDGKTAPTKLFNKDTTEGRVQVFNCLPKYAQTEEMFDLINKHLDKPAIEKFLEIAIDKLLPDDWLNLINSLTKLGIDNSITSISIRDFIINEKDKAALRNMKYSKLTRNNVVSIIESGARGKWEQYLQTTTEKGLINDVLNRIVGHIDKPLLAGLSPKEFFMSAYGGRKGLIDTAENTAKAGYFTRKLVYLSSSVTLDPDVDDCQTNKYIDVYIDERMAPLVIGRYYIDSGGKSIKITSVDQVLGRRLKLRSPITCGLKGHKVCRKCYGDYKLHSKMIGIIAAQSLGERATQLTLRTKHTSGAGSAFPTELYNHIEMHENEFIAKIGGHVERNKQRITLVFDDDWSIEVTNYGTFVCAVEKFEPKQVIGFLKSTDIVSTVMVLQEILNRPQPNISINNLLNKILDVYGKFAKVYLVHFETILQSMVRAANDINILYKNSKSDKYIVIGMEHAINKHPEQSLAFERFRMKLQNYIIDPNLPEVTDPSLLKMIAFFDLDDREVLYE